MSLYENLISMGYGRGAAAAALKQTNNDLNQALEVKLEVSIGTFVLLKKDKSFLGTKLLTSLQLKYIFLKSTTTCEHNYLEFKSNGLRVI